MDSPAFVPIIQVVDSFMNATGIYSAVNRRRFLKIVAENYADLNINNTNLFKTVFLTINSLNAIEWPIDYVDYVRIGTPWNGQICTLTKNDKITGKIVLVCGAEEQDTGLMQPVNQPWIHAYGASNGVSFMFYRSDKETHRIIFEGDGVGRTIALQYISSGVSADGQTLIPLAMVKLMRKYLQWVYMDFDEIKQHSQSEITRVHRDFIQFREEYERLDNGFTADEFLDAMRQSYRLTPKN